MKAMVLAAGLGERMRPLTNTTPKPLLEVGGRPLLDYHLERLASAGVRDVVVNVSWLAEQLIAFCGDGSRWGLRLSVSHEPKPLETAGGIIHALPLLGASPFLVINGDVFTDYPLSQLLAVRLAPHQAHLVLVPNPVHHPHGDFPLEKGCVLAGDTSRPNFTYSGLGVFQASFFQGATEGKQPLKPWLDRAIAAGALYGECWDGCWTDVGTPQRLRELDTALRNETSATEM